MAAFTGDHVLNFQLNVIRYIQM